MTLPVIDDVIELALKAEYDNTEDVVNVFNFRMQAGSITTQADWISDLEELADALVAIVKGMSGAITVWKRFVVRYRNKVEPSIALEISPQVAGTLTGSPLGAGVCALMVFRTEKPRTVLRKFFGPATTGVIDSEGKWSSTYQTGLAADLVSLSTAFVLTNSTWIYTHWDEAAQDVAAITGGYASSEPAYQRRRRRGRGS